MTLPYLVVIACTRCRSDQHRCRQGRVKICPSLISPSSPCRHNARGQGSQSNPSPPTALPHRSHSPTLNFFRAFRSLTGPFRQASSGAERHSQIALPPATCSDSGPTPPRSVSTSFLAARPEQGNGTATAVLRTHPDLQLSISPIGSSTAKLLNNGHAFIRAAHCELM